MTDISNSADTLDVRDIIERVEELREQRTIRIVAGWNMPGYMPDMTPAEIDGWDDARAFIAEELRQRAGYAMLDDTRSNEETDEEESELVGAADELDACITDHDFGRTIAGTHYFITEDGVMGLDDDETEELRVLEELLDDLKGYGGDHQWCGDWYPVTLIRDDYFQEFAEEYANEAGDMPADSWPHRHIDWEAAADELKQDYSTVDYDGAEYYYR